MFQNNTKARINLAAAEVKADIMKFFAKWDVANCERLGKIEKEIEMFGRKTEEIRQLKSRVELLEERNLKLHARLKKVEIETGVRDDTSRFGSWPIQPQIQTNKEIMEDLDLLKEGLGVELKQEKKYYAKKENE